MKSKTVVKPRNALGFQYWLRNLGYNIKHLSDGSYTASTNDKQIKTTLRYVRIDGDLGGNPAAFILGEEFETHLVSPADVKLEMVA